MAPCSPDVTRAALERLPHGPCRARPLRRGRDRGAAGGGSGPGGGCRATEPAEPAEPEHPEPDAIPGEGAVDRSGVLIQLFHWYLPADGSWWRTSAERAAELADAGFTAVWLPPAYKGHVGGYDVGYGVYDLYDLGEFDQKGSVRTRYGTKDEYLAAIAALQTHGLAVYADIVWNHRLGGDEAEVVLATPYSAFDRREAIGPTREVEVWTRFTFPGRGGVHDQRTLDASYFDAVDHDELRPDEWDTIYLFQGKEFDPDVDEEYGNYSYLMGCDLDHDNEAVRDMFMSWGRWYLDFTAVDGLRMDAVKHMPTWALPVYLDALRAHRGSMPLPVVGEYWSPHLSALEHFLDATGGTMALFDVPLHHSLHQAGRDGASFDLRTLFDDSLVANRPRARGDLRRQPRLPAHAGAGDAGRGLVQARGLRGDPAAPRRAALRVRRRLRRRRVHRPALG